MKYNKPSLTHEQQADLLLARGMVGDRDLMIQRLAAVNYYRLSGYWYPFRNRPSDDFNPGTNFEAVWARYAFDRRLRVLVMDALERVEIAFRAWLAYHHAHATTPFAYAIDPSALPGLRADERARFLAAVADEMERSKETFADHFQKKYGKDHPYMPIWMASEIMTFGHVVTLFRGSSAAIKQAVARRIGMHDTVVFSWLLALNTMRNACAHHARLWNRELGTKPMIPKKDVDWHQPVQVGNNRIFGILTVLKYCLDRIAPQSGWQGRLRSLLDEYATVPKKSMGFPDNWELCPIWRGPG